MPADARAYGVAPWEGAGRLEGPTGLLRPLKRKRLVPFTSYT